MFEVYQGVVCVAGGAMIDHFISKPYYDKLSRNGTLKIKRRACKGVASLVQYDSLPNKIRRQIEAVHGHPGQAVKELHFQHQIQPDPKAAEFYSDHLTADGNSLPPENQIRYGCEARILNTLIRLSQRRQRGMTASEYWQKLADQVARLDRETFPHSLPKNGRSLQRKAKKYQNEGYSALIHKQFANGNARKVDDRIKRLVLSLYSMRTKPYVTEVLDMYLQFLGGRLDVVDRQTGELMDRKEFMKDGAPIVLSESSVWNILREHLNRATVERQRNDTLYWATRNKPTHFRKAPKYSLSLISMDDRDLPRRMVNGKRLKTYLAYDVASGIVVGYAFSPDKNSDLFISCMRNMFRFLHGLGLGMPMECQVEHHLVNSFKHDLMKAGNVFKWVTWAVPGNAAEKYAEQFNRQMKYGYEARYQEGIGRPFGAEAKRPKRKKDWDGGSDAYKDRLFTRQELEADAIGIIQEYNNGLHRDQKRYPGKTRMEVFLENVNPNLTDLKPEILARYIGDCTETSIRQNKVLQVLYTDYM
ncbi:MAG: hypothetical protein AAGL66_16710, partial [Pseudomonadota bacterium]